MIAAGNLLLITDTKISPASAQTVHLPRPVSDGRVADVVHEPSRATPMSPLISMPTSDAEAEGTGNAAPRAGVAEATLTGTLNGKPLWLRRRKGARVNQLFLKHDGKDLTRQIAK